MPFTLAHPAAVLPLIRRPFVASALVAGAVAPDLLYVDPFYRFAKREINAVPRAAPSPPIGTCRRELGTPYSRRRLWWVWRGSYS